MVYKKFSVLVFIRIILIFFNCLWLSFTISQSEKVYTLIVISGLLIIQIVDLLKYVNKTNVELARFFTSLKDEYSFYKLADNKKSKSFSKLSEILNETGNLLKKIRMEREKQFQFMKFIFDSAPVGMIILSDQNKVKQVNNSALKLLKIKELYSLKQLSTISHDLENEINKLKAGQQKLIKIPTKTDILVFLFSVNSFILENLEYKLIIIQDFSNELEASEIESWHKLIRVVNHEILNSITPIITLTEAIKRGFIRNDKLISKNDVDEALISDTIINTELIEDRSKGLKEFVENYRSISRITSLNIQEFHVKPMIENIFLLLNHEIESKNILTEIIVIPENLKLEGDENLLGQVLINLIKNAITALNETISPFIKVNASFNKSSNLIIRVIDNGEGIPEENMEKIFIPFFTTCDEGAGIGLSLSRHILRLHKATISANSIPGKQMEFVIKF